MAASEVTFPALGVATLVGTAEDLYRWSEALYTDRVLSAYPRRKLFAPAFDDMVNGWYTTKTRDGVITSKGALKGYQVIGSSLTRGRMIETFIRFDLERESPSRPRNARACSRTTARGRKDRRSS